MKEYRLDPLVKLRRRQVDAAARDVGTAQTNATARERESAGAATRKTEHADSARAVRDSESAALATSSRTAADLRQLAEWQVCSDDTQEQLEQQLVEKRVAESHARDAVVRARTALVSRRADARVIEDHRDAWNARERQDDEQRVEEEIGDVHAARRKERG